MGLGVIGGGLWLQRSRKKKKSLTQGGLRVFEK